MKLPPYVQSFVDPAGTRRLYFRKRGMPRVTLPNPAKDKRAFLAAYTAALGAHARPTRDLKAGTLDALITAYLASSEYRDLKPNSKATYRHALEFLRKRPSIGRAVASITREEVLALRDEIAAKTPGKANLVIKVMRVLMGFAMDRGYRVDTPMMRVKSVKGGEYRSWTDAELLQFEARWPRGTTERLIYELALGTGQRRGDIAKMTWADVTDDGINVVQEKTGAKLWIPCHVSLGDELGKAPQKHAVIVATPTGRGYTPKYMGVSFSRAIDKAALPDDCVLHGLRKAAARRLAEAGCSERQIMSITGHKSAQEVDRYTRQADQKVSAKAAILKLTRNDPV